MKHIEFKTSKGEFVAVELPLGAIRPVVSMGYITYKEYNEANGYPVELITDPISTQEWLDKHDTGKDYIDRAVKFVCENAILISHLPLLTEEQANDIIKFGHYCPHNYTYHKGYWDVEKNTFKEHNTAIESLNTLLEANGVCFESTYPDYDQALKHYETDLYWEAQSKVWNKQQTYLFKKK